MSIRTHCAPVEPIASRSCARAKPDSFWIAPPSATPADRDESAFWVFDSARAPLAWLAWARDRGIHPHPAARAPRLSLIGEGAEGNHDEDPGHGNRSEGKW
jgi:hypothetical protein